MTVLTDTLTDTIQASAKPSGHKKRLNIWEIQYYYHFSIISFCLTSYERNRLLADESSNNFEGCELKIIQSLLAKIQKRSAEALKVQELLDKKFKIYIEKVSRHNEKDLEGVWLSSKENLEMNGLYWAIMSHGSANHLLRNRVFQEVSINSYQNCCKILSVQKQHEILRHEVMHKNEKLDELEQQVKERKCAYCHQISHLEQELSLAKYEIDRLQRHLSLYTRKREK